VAFMTCALSVLAAPAGASIEELVTQWGYNISRFRVETLDGCALTVFSVCDFRRESAWRPPVLLQHGFEDSATTWVINRPNESLGLLLASAGFRVFLGNSRGNRYSTGKEAEGIRSKSYWDWSFDEMGRYDLPAVISAIKRTTGATSVPVVGHSQGTTQTFAALASNISLDDGTPLAASVPLFVALAPAVFPKHVSSPLFDAAFKLDAGELLALAGAYDLMANGSLPAALSAIVCGVPSRWQRPCDSVLRLLFGYNASHLDPASVGRYMSHVPSGTSIFDLIHFAQLYRASQLGAPVFRRYDHGPLANLRAYGQLEPPSYDLSRLPLQTELALYSGSLDTLADPRDVEYLVSKLPRPPLVHRKLAGYGHLDFVWGSTAAADVYAEAISLIERAHAGSALRAAPKHGERQWRVG